mmetsp:Transcript_39834/g.125382  ORF Transcript_39834/g.125382 Transcript_39834/m.125382 type:complete len:203 (-) Transcript_39834:37-645(-)
MHARRTCTGCCRANSQDPGVGSALLPLQSRGLLSSLDELPSSDHRHAIVREIALRDALQVPDGLHAKPRECGAKFQVRLPAHPSHQLHELAEVLLLLCVVLLLTQPHVVHGQGHGTDPRRQPRLLLAGARRRVHGQGAVQLRHARSEVDIDAVGDGPRQHRQLTRSPPGARRRRQRGRARQHPPGGRRDHLAGGGKHWPPLP